MLSVHCLNREFEIVRAETLISEVMSLCSAKQGGWSSDSEASLVM